MSISDGDGLRAAILAQPDDDTLRLIYADWLQENDQPDRAEFVRAQVAASQAEPYSPQAGKQIAIAKRLHDAHPEWGQEVRKWVNGAQFARGFIEHVNVNAATFPRDAAALFAHEPVRSILLMRFVATTTVSLVPFFDLPQLDSVRRLDLNHLQLSPEESELLVETPQLVNLTDLGLRDNAVQPEWLEKFLTGLAMPELEGLDLSGLSHLGPRLADVLPRLDRRFKQLDLGHVPFTSDQMQRVLGSWCLREVEELRLAWMTAAGQKGPITNLNLGWVFPLNRLRVLDLNSQGIGAEGVQELINGLTRHKEPPPLRWLGLAYNQIGAEGVRALVRSDPEQVKLYHLDVSGNGLNLSQRAALQTRFPEAVVVN